MLDDDDDDDRDDGDGRSAGSVDNDRSVYKPPKAVRNALDGK